MTEQCIFYSDSTVCVSVQVTLFFVCFVIYGVKKMFRLVFYCLTDATYILYDENTVTDVFLCLGIKRHDENMPGVFNFFAIPQTFLPRIIKTSIFIRCIKQNYKSVETSVKQWQKCAAPAFDAAMRPFGHRVAVWC